MGKNNWGGYRKGAGRTPLDEKEKKKGIKIYVNDYLKEDIEKYGVGKSTSEKAAELIKSEVLKRKNKQLEDEYE
ncbi:hypothetical protein SAMN02745135_02367 [Caloranaerobacter azorensis DSM 13643]|uniref:Uncharacterized protein n=1 Tax=Caloranaerobacter azorensis DSM 13643 TaxID=1121264 RepID=A0A1M5WA35_9FIRM|nr:hypothetical protein [Caloranaerobacter azorensis]SHH84327.1 hypothetical protein SAMN02745135_02367 [Caloranaerobacter azorensis DSM 13643]